MVRRGLVVLLLALVQPYELLGYWIQGLLQGWKYFFQDYRSITCFRSSAHARTVFSNSSTGIFSLLTFRVTFYVSSSSKQLVRKVKTVKRLEMNMLRSVGVALQDKMPIPAYMHHETRTCVFCYVPRQCCLSCKAAASMNSSRAVSHRICCSQHRNPTAIVGVAHRNNPQQFSVYFGSLET